MRGEAISATDGRAAVARSASGRFPFMAALAFLQRLLRFVERPQRQLRLCESLTLGDRRFVAVVQFERRRFLVGGTGQSLGLLAELDEAGRAGTEDEG